MKQAQLILVVDDEIANRELLEAFLSPHGYDLIFASNGEEALQLLADHEIDLVLLDVLMPGLNGFEVTRRVRQVDRLQRLPIILVTALRESEDRVAGIEAGCDDFISKPIEKNELLARVRSLLKVKAYNDLAASYRAELEAEVRKRTQELYHRTKNNMQVITSLLFLKAQTITDEKLSSDYLEMANRIQTMAMVHEKMIINQDLSLINMKSYIGDLVSYVMHSFAEKSQHITVVLEIESFDMLFDMAIPCGLVINELLSNALKYSCPDKKSGVIKIALAKDDAHSVDLQISDSGIGLPPDLDIHDERLYGLKIAVSIIEHQLKGTIQVLSGPGLVYQIHFIDNIYQKRI